MCYKRDEGGLRECGNVVVDSLREPDSVTQVNYLKSACGAVTASPKKITLVRGI